MTRKPHMVSVVIQVYRQFGPRTLRTFQTSDLGHFGMVPKCLNHIRSNSSLILRCKTLFHKTALVPKCLTDTLALVLKCPGSEVSRVRSVCTPLYGYDKIHKHFILGFIYCKPSCKHARTPYTIIHYAYNVMC